MRAVSKLSVFDLRLTYGLALERTTSKPHYVWYDIIRIVFSKFNNWDLSYSKASIVVTFWLKQRSLWNFRSSERAFDKHFHICQLTLQKPQIRFRDRFVLQKYKFLSLKIKKTIILNMLYSIFHHTATHWHKTQSIHQNYTHNSRLHYPHCSVSKGLNGNTSARARR